MDMLDAYLKAARSKSLWVNLDTLEVIPNSELKMKIVRGELTLKEVAASHSKYPVYGDVERAIRVHLPILVRLAHGNTTRGLICHPNVRGFSNPTMTSCFMDSTLLAMFSHKGSPFFANMIEKPVSSGELTCSDDPERNEELVNRIRNLLAKDIQAILNGGAKVCSQLRTALGRDCRIGDWERDLSKGMQDPGELYGRLTRALGYEPLELQYRKFRTQGDQMSDPRSDPPVGAQMLDPVNARNDDLEVITWPGPWGPSEIDVEDGVLHTELSVLKADVIVISVDRRDSLKGPDTKLTSRRLKIDQVLNVRLKSGVEKRFTLGSVVFSPTDGHFASLLKCESDWFIYNDLNVSKPFEENREETSSAIKKIETRGVLLFYYESVEI